MLRIITDSSTLYTVEEGKKLQIDVVPLSVTINGQTYREYEELDAEQFHAIIDQGFIPTSSQPPIGEYLALFEKYAEDDILVIAMADGLSGTYQSCAGAKEMTDRSNIVVINSKTLSIPHRLLVNRAITMRDQGYTLAEIVAELQTKCETSKSFLLPQDFDFLQRGGRLTMMAAKISGLLKIQPVVMQTSDGTRLEKFTVGRNFNKAVYKVLDHLKAAGIGEDYHFCISHAFVPEQAQAVAKKIQAQFNVQQVELAELSCVFITQGGPYCLAIQVIQK